MTSGASSFNQATVGEEPLLHSSHPQKSQMNPAGFYGGKSEAALGEARAHKNQARCSACDVISSRLLPDLSVSTERAGVEPRGGLLYLRFSL